MNVYGSAARADRDSIVMIRATARTYAALAVCDVDDGGRTPPGCSATLERIMRRLGLVTVLTVCLAMLGIPIALADTTLESGTLSCGVGKVPIAVTYGYGHFFLRGPGDASPTYYNVAGTTLTRKTNSGPGGYWAAGLWGTGAVDTSQTHAYCYGT